MTSAIINVILAYDHTVVREGVSALLKNHPDISVVGQAADVFSAVDLIRKLNEPVQAVRSIYQGRHYLSPQVAEILLHTFKFTEHLEVEKSIASQMTKRERNSATHR